MKSLSLKSKVRLSITTLVLTISVGTVCVFYHHARNELLEEIRERLHVVAGTITPQVDGDIHELLLTRKDESTPAYKQIRNILKGIQDSNPSITYVYTMCPGKKPMVWEFVVDAADGENMSHIGDTYDVSEYPALRAGLSRPSTDEELTYDKWGVWISGYAPIYNKQGRSVGIIGVDMSATQLAGEMAEMRRIGILCTLIAILFAVVLGSVLSSYLMAPVSLFIERLNAAGRGDLDTLVDDHRTDEIGDLAKTFNNMLTALRHKDEMLREMNIDYLTGLRNHRFFQQCLEDELVRAEETGGTVALVMLDIDRFKLINDSLGHVTGDRILQQMSGILLDSVGEGHTVARYGGEEFVIILPGMDQEDALRLADDLREAVAEFPFSIAAGAIQSENACSAQISVTVSAGMAVYPVHSREQDGLIVAADIALYRAKHMGRNRVCTYVASDESGRADPYQVYTFIRDPNQSTIEALAAAVDARDHYTHNHSDNVSRYTAMIGASLGLTDSDMEMLRMASLLHDVGKIGVPDFVLNKPAGLTEEEMEIIRTHPAVGEAIVRNSGNLDSILPGILYHHERFDGSGYPHGVAGHDIPLIARIIAIADAFDAMTTDRPYRRALSADEAIQVLRDGSGVHFDPEIVEHFISQLSITEVDQHDIAA